MSADKQLFDNIKGDFGKIPGISEVPADIAPETVEFLKGLEGVRVLIEFSEDVGNLSEKDFSELSVKFLGFTPECKRAFHRVRTVQRAAVIADVGEKTSQGLGRCNKKQVIKFTV